MPIDLARVRADTRAAETVAHLNNAGASLPPAIVMDVVHEHLRNDEVFGGYEAHEFATERLAQAHASVATLVGGKPAEVAFLDSATRAWQTALYSLPWKKGDHILASEAEYPSNVYAFLHLRDRFGVETTYVPDDEHGQIDVNALEAAIRPTTRLIALTHIPTYGGLINPAESVGKVARAAGVLYLLDACQSVGQLHVDVAEIGCDMLTSAGRKYLRGPRGTAFMWVRNEVSATMDSAFSDNYGASWTAPESFMAAPHAQRFEQFERSVALQLGLGAAARYATDIGTRNIEERVISLGATLRASLREIRGVEVHDRGECLGGIVTFTVAGIAPSAVQTALQAAQINTSITTQGYAMRSFPGRGLTDVSRASVHYYNTDEEITATTDVIRALVA